MLALVVTVVFIIVRVTPGDPAAVMLGSDATPEDTESRNCAPGWGWTRR